MIENSDKLDKVAEELSAELEELYKSPEFVRANEIIEELKRMKKFKYIYRNLAKGAIDLTPIDDLGLNVRTCSYIKRAGIYTISDIINLPRENWYKVRGLGRNSLEELITKMHEMGYKDFYVKIWPGDLRASLS